MIIKETFWLVKKFVFTGMRGLALVIFSFAGVCDESCHEIGKREEGRFAQRLSRTQDGRELGAGSREPGAFHIEIETSDIRRSDVRRLLGFWHALS